MRKSIALLLSLALLGALVLAGCGASEPPAESNLSGSAADVLADVIEASGEDFGMTFDEPVTNGNSTGYLGLTAEEFDEYVDEAFASNAAMTTSAHMIAVIKCKDADAAAQVKALSAANYDSGRWICVMPEQSFIVESGSYVLLASVTDDAAQAIQTAFTELAGTAGELDVFFVSDRA